MDPQAFKGQYDQMSVDDQKLFAELAGLKPPDQHTNSKLWLIVVTTFSLLLLGGTLMLFFLIRAEDSTEVIGPIVTAALGVLAGLLAPSPVQESKSGN